MNHSLQIPSGFHRTLSDLERQRDIAIAYEDYTSGQREPNHSFSQGKSLKITNYKPAFDCLNHLQRILP